jgi:glycosyltransferase involved in cell wall biosynthesis
LKKILYFHNGRSRYDEFFIDSLNGYFQMEYVTLNPRPRIHFQNSVPVKLYHPLSFLYNSPVTRPVVQYTGVPAIRSVIGNKKPDAIIGAYATTYGYLCARTNFHPNILFAFGSDILIDPKRPLLRSLVIEAVRNADLILIDSIVQENAVLTLGAESKKTIRIPWLNSRSIAEIPSSTVSVRKNMGWEKDIIVVCTRSHEKIYQVDKVLLAFSVMHKQFPQSRLILAGGGPQTPNLKKLASSLNIGSSVLFPGWLPKNQAIGLYDESDLYVSASLSDGTSASLIEAMIRGLPTLVSDIEGNREWVIDHENGMLFDPHCSIDQFAEKMIECVAMPLEFRNRIIRTARTMAMNRADWTQNGMKLCQAIDRVIGGAKSDLS